MDPVLEVALTFYNDQLFRITITYDQSRTDGMTNADVIDAVSATYGLAVVPATPHAPPRSSPALAPTPSRLPAGQTGTAH